MEMIDLTCRMDVALICLGIALTAPIDVTSAAYMDHETWWGEALVSPIYWGPRFAAAAVLAITVVAT